MERGMKCGKVQTWRMLALLVVLSSSFTTVTPLTIWVLKEECVYEYVVYEGDTVSGNFVSDIWHSDHAGPDFTITGPGAIVVQTLNERTESKFEFKAPKAGMYKFCFHTSHPVSVSFYIHIGHIPTEQDIAKNEHFEPLAVQIYILSEALESVKSEQIYLKAQDTRHRHTNESTGKRVIYCTVGEYILLALISVLQVVYIRRLFSKSVGYNRF